MKKLTLAATLTFLAAPLAFADTIFGVYAGAGVWQSDYSGKAGDPSITLKDLGVKDQDNNFYYVAIEHPVPVLPNIRLEHIELTTKQTATVNKTFVIDETAYVVGQKVQSEFDLTHTDATFYYEVLDNWLNLDVGITARKFDGYVFAKSDTASKKVKIDDTLPLVYAKFQFDLPLTGLSAGADINYVNYNDDKVSDYRVRISYLFDSAVDFGIEAGYRKLSITVDEDDIKAKVDLKGPYASAIFHF